MKKNPVVHFEMGYKNLTRVSKFYSSVFGWGMNDSGSNMGHYVLAETTETGNNRMPKSPGAINGGFYDVTKAKPEPSVVISVDDVKKSMENVVKAGGTILGDVQNIPGVGLWVSFQDTEGNRVSILQPSM